MGRPRLYCSNRCKLTERAAAGNRGALGKVSTEFPKAADLREREASHDTKLQRSRRGKQRKAGRYANRRTLWKISGDRSCRACGRTVMDPDAGVVLAQGADGTAVELGLLKCGKIWLCSVCSAKIRHGRAEEITRAVVEWIQRGGTAYLVTFTARHAAADQLADLMDAIQGTRADVDKGIKRRPGAYQRLITGGTWAGRPERGESGIRDRVGYIGMIRATEVTLGQANGWHPHIHAIVFVGGRTAGERSDKHVVEVFEPGDDALSEWRGHFRGVWTRHLAKVDPSFKPSDRHGVDFKPLETVQDAEDLGKYIAKIQDGTKTVSPANELARGDLKKGRRGNMAPFQMLGRIGDLMGGVQEEDADGHGDLDWCLAKWAEYETATKGRRAIEWTRYLRGLLGIDGGDTEEDDIDKLFEMDKCAEFRAGVHVKTTAWHKVAHRALDLSVVDAMESGRLGDVIDLVSVAAGRDGARIMTSGEVTEIMERVMATMRERREAAAVRRQAQKSV